MLHKLHNASTTLTQPSDQGNALKQQDRSVFTRLVETRLLKPGHQYRISLGFFGDNNPAKGFSVEFEALPALSGTERILTRTAAAGTPARYELLLYITNHSKQAVQAGIWQMGR